MTGAVITDALFVADGDRFVPTVHARGPWDPGALHGGPPAALAARAVERVGSDAPMAVARLTVELLRPVPMRPLSLSTRTVRPGRKVQLVEATLRDGDVEVCRAVALRLRVLTAGGAAGDLPAAPPGPHTGVAEIGHGEGEGFHRTGVEFRFVSGRFSAPGTATVWIRLRYPVVGGEAPSPLMRAVAAADFGNGVSAVLDWDRYSFINPDLTVYLHRQPVGEWICLAAGTRAEPGRGLAHCMLFDERGAIGHSLQALLVDAR